jgi:hypothetical protein
MRTRVDDSVETVSEEETIAVGEVEVKDSQSQAFVFASQS